MHRVRRTLAEVEDRLYRQPLDTWGKAEGVFPWTFNQGFKYSNKNA